MFIFYFYIYNFHTIFFLLQVIESKNSKHMFKNHSDSSQMIGKIDKLLEKKTFFNNEILKIIRGMLLALPILFLCYHGPMQYSILENGQILQGFPPRKTIMTFSLGYSASHSIIYTIVTGMLIYSIILVNNIILK